LTADKSPQPQDPPAKPGPKKVDEPQEANESAEAKESKDSPSRKRRRRIVLVILAILFVAGAIFGIKTLIFLFIFATIVELPALLFMGLWFGMQLFSGLKVIS